MTTYIVDPDNPDPEAIHAAAEAIRRGELIVFPTETVYGLAADAMNESAVKRVFEAKGRPGGMPLPVQIAEAGQLGLVADHVPETASKLARAFWPGPLTIVVPRSKGLPEAVTAGGDTVGVRVPDHAVALALLRELDSPMVATSANISGQPPATTADQAASALADHVAVVLDAGESEVGVASSVVDVTVAPPVIVREGAIDFDQIRMVVGETIVNRAN